MSNQASEANEVPEIVQPLVAFHTDIEPVTAKPNAVLPMDSGFLEQLSDGSEHSIKEFLSRPVVINTGTWDNTGARNHVLAQVRVPEDLIQGSLAVSQKIAGFYALRAKMVIRLQVNCNRFQQGRLLMYFFPQDTVSQMKYLTTTGSLYYSTQLPRIDFDANTDTEVVLEVPFNSPYLAYDTTIGTGHCGVVNLTVYEPLFAASGSLSSKWTIWAHFEDIELLYPTISNPTFVPQAGGKTRRLRVGNRGATTDDETEHKPVSGTLMTISKVASVLGEVPLLSSIATPVSWAAAIAGKTAAAFGFSNPGNFGPVGVMQQRLHSKAINVSGEDNCINMGLAEDNHLELLPSFAVSGIDEMAFMYPLSIPTYVGTLNWSDTSPAWTQIAGYRLSPSDFIFANSQAYDTIPVSYIGNFFKYYKGSFKFKLKFVKTEFHSGRLQLSFLPGYLNSTPGVITAQNSGYLHKEIIDIRAMTEFEFVCPWVNTAPMLEYVNNYGYMTINVINELTHPDTVATSIPIILEVSCGSDFQFAVPNNNSLVPYLYKTSGTSQAADTVWVPQAGEADIGQQDQSEQASNTQAAVGSSALNVEQNLSAARFCVGEYVNSFRQLVKRATPSARIFITSGSGDTLYQSICHDNVICLYNTTTNAWEPQNTTYLSVTQNCYAYSRGAYRYRYYSSNVGTPDISKVAIFNGTDYHADIVSLIYPQSDNRKDIFTPVIPSGDFVYPNPEVSVPHYSKFAMFPLAVDNDGNIPLIQFRPDTFRKVWFRNSDSDIVIWETKQAGDDYSCGMWTGSCPLVDPVIAGPTAFIQSW